VTHRLARTRPVTTDKKSRRCSHAQARRALASTPASPVQHARTTPAAHAYRALASNVARRLRRLVPSSQPCQARVLRGRGRSRRGPRSAPSVRLRARTACTGGGQEQGRVRVGYCLCRAQAPGLVEGRAPRAPRAAACAQPPARAPLAYAARAPRGGRAPCGRARHARARPMALPPASAGAARRAQWARPRRHGAPGRARPPAARRARPVGYRLQHHRIKRPLCQRGVHPLSPRRN